MKAIPAEDVFAEFETPSGSDFSKPPEMSFDRSLVSQRRPRCRHPFQAWTLTWKIRRSFRTFTIVSSPTFGKTFRRACLLRTSQRLAAGSGLRCRGARLAQMWRCAAQSDPRLILKSLPGLSPSLIYLLRIPLWSRSRTTNSANHLLRFILGATKENVASIEVLSLANKTPGNQGRDLYKHKQKEILASQVHLVEIDLLRDGEHTTAIPLKSAIDACGPFEYHVSVHGFDDLETFFMYPIRLEDCLPPVAIPLLLGDSAVTVDLQAVFDRCYDAGPYAREILYGEDAVIPPLQTDQAAWAEQVLHAERG